MLLRTITALVGLAVLLGALWGGVPWVFLLVSLAAVLGLREFYRLHPPDRATDAPPITSISDSQEEPAASLLSTPDELTASPADSRVADLSTVPALEPSNNLIDGPPDSTPDEPPADPVDVTAVTPMDSAPGKPPADPVDVTAVTPMDSAPDESLTDLEVEPEANPAPLNPAQSTPLPFPLGALWVIAFVIGGAAADSPAHFAAISLGILSCGAFVALLWLIAFYRGERWPVAAAYLVGGPVYVGFLLAHVLLLVQVGDAGDSYELGRNWLLFALLATFATDTGAYLTGRAVGRHPMAPSISPNKTWEGAVGGFVGAIAAAALLDQFFNLGLGPTNWFTAWNWQPLLIGATVGIAAQAGDLLESKLKRLSQVKDAGSLMPGHGGLLDRLDSLLITIPAVYYLWIITN